MSDSLTRAVCSGEVLDNAVARLIDAISQAIDLTCKEVIENDR